MPDPSKQFQVRKRECVGMHVRVPLTQCGSSRHLVKMLPGGALDHSADGRILNFTVKASPPVS